MCITQRNYFSYFNAKIHEKFVMVASEFDIEEISLLYGKYSLAYNI